MSGEGLIMSAWGGSFMPDLEAIGDAATGAVVAGTVEPRTGAAADGHTHEANCLNCGTELAGDYCHACGQKAHVHRSLTAFWHDLAHGVLHLDGKVWRTMPLLAWRPGELTRRYTHGERAKFVSPMALFLFSVFLMFAVFSLVGGPVVGGSGPAGGVVTDRNRASAELNKATEESRAELRALQQQRERLVAAGWPTADVDADIREKQREIAIEERLTRGFIPERDAIATVNATRSADGGLTISTGAESVDDWFNAAYKRAKENPKLLLYKLQSNAYKFSWLLIPISIPLVWLLFLHRRRYRQQFTAYDHTVFVTYSIAFMSLAAIALSLLGWLGFPAGIISLAILIVPPVHIYRQLKGAYGLSRASALWRTAALLILSFVALSLFAAILLMAEVFG
jgi:hypothetical protein